MPIEAQGNKAHPWWQTVPSPLEPAEVERLRRAVGLPEETP